MRNRKSLLSISIFALILVLSVGYAVVNYVDLTVGGEISASTENIDVSFKSVNPVKVTATAHHKVCLRVSFTRS